MIFEQIESRLIDGLEPLYLDIQNESRMHSGPAAESHFKVIIVSTLFSELSRIDRHRKVNDLLKELFEIGLHALSILPFSPAEWEGRGGEPLPSSPVCASKR
ncbi:MAG: BolA family transcriptional regulator [Bdellovibrionales bacterium]|nr:BolA family transcriptional regulator [Bdellovibrionales bacterium]